MNNQIQYYQDKLNYEMDPSDLFDVLEKERNIIVVDTRQKFGFDKEHIPGAINLPHLDMNEESTKPLSKKVLYICYCDGIGCNASTKGALKLARLGFKVKELIGGLEWWKLDGYATEGRLKTKGNSINCAC